MDEPNDNEEVPPPPKLVRARAKPSTQTGRPYVKAKLDNKKINATEDTSDHKAKHKYKSKPDEAKLVRKPNRRSLFDAVSPSGEELSNGEESPSDEKPPTDEESECDDKAPINKEEKCITEMDELNDNEEVPPPKLVRARAKPSTQTGRPNVKAKLVNKKKNATEDTSDDKANVRSKFGRLPNDLSNSLSATHKQKSKTDEHVNLESKLVRTRNRRTSSDEESPSGEESQSDEKAPIHEQEKEMDELNDNKEVRPPKPVRARDKPSIQTGNVRAKLDNKKKNATGSNLKTEDTSDDKANVRSEFGSLPSVLSTSLPAIPKHKSKTDEQVSLEMKLKLALGDEESSSNAESPSNEKPPTDEEPQRDEEPLNYLSFKLIIICKTTMHGGICFMGLDTKRNRLLRPICSTNECCWPDNDSTNKIHVGSLVKFKVKYHPDQSNKSVFRTPYPHRNDDMLVEKNIIVGKRVPNVWDLLLSLSKQDIYDIFPQNLIKKTDT